MVLPIAAVTLYFASWRLAPEFFLRRVASEHGVVELGTAAFFAASSYLAARLALATAAGLPMTYRVLYGLFAVAALFVALEEISYGQHLFGWESPEFFRENNLQREVNLHNLLSSKPSKRLHLIADLGTALGFVLMPLLLVGGRRMAAARPSFPARGILLDAYRRGTWSHYLVPGMELIAIVLLARLVGWLKKVPGAGVDHNELRELLWAWAAFGYAALMTRRLYTDAGREVVR
jgi:hypothetical protein